MLLYGMCCPVSSNSPNLRYYRGKSKLKTGTSNWAHQLLNNISPSGISVNYSNIVSSTRLQRVPIKELQIDFFPNKTHSNSYHFV